MIIVNVKFKNIAISKFDIKKGLEFKICFDDGEERCINKASLIEDPMELTETIFQEIRQMVKRYNQQYGSDTFDDVVIIRFENEDTSRQKMSNFFSKVQEELRTMRSVAPSNYLRKIEEINKIKVEF